MRQIRKSLESQFTVLLVLIFFVVLLLVNLGSSYLLSQQVQTEITQRATMLMDTLSSVRLYTSENIRSLLTKDLETSEIFIRESVPSFSANQVFEKFKDLPQYTDFLYKEAATNPTIIKDRANTFESELLQAFRQYPKQNQEVSGFIEQDSKTLFYISRPLKVNDISCLQCHGRPESAPASLIRDYGRENGFNWQLGEIVAAQTVYVPAGQIYMVRRERVKLLICISVGATLLSILLIKYLFKVRVTQPLKRLTYLARSIIENTSFEQISRLMEATDLKPLARRQDEPGYLFLVFKRMIHELQSRAQQLQTSRKNAEAQTKVKEKLLRENLHLYEEAQATLEQLKSAHMQLIQQEKMATVGNLLSGVAHEINNPLGFLSGNLEELETSLSEIREYYTLQQNNSPQARIEDYAEEIDLDYLLQDLPNMIRSMQLGCERIQKLTSSLRNFSRLDQQSKEWFNLHEGLDSTLLILKHRLKANSKRPAIKVIFHYSDVEKISCFPSQLNQVFMNILANAIDALEEASQNQTWQMLEDEPNYIWITTEQEDEIVMIKIRDNGPGMSEETLARIFDYLFTTKPVGKGTEMGLAIAYKIITETHQGHLTVWSEPGNGTEFTIQLPKV
ncbi:MAG: DUF3365 domain-containing protein [Spirulina sp. SIO3F2]|nr:DUF3365 domain-containing protein [Spirulina sp. SIO3F2]